MSCRQSYIGDQIEAGFVDVLRLCGLEAHPVGDPMLLGVLARLHDGGLVKVVTDKFAVWIRLGHEDCGESHSAADVSDLGVLGEFAGNTVQRGNPVLHDIVDVTGPEEGTGGTKQAPG